MESANFGSHCYNISNVSQTIDDIDMLEEDGIGLKQIPLADSLMEKLDFLYKWEENNARQKSRCKWFKEGDSNSGFFPNFANYEVNIIRYLSLRHFFLCIYGTVALVFILAGELQKYKIIEILTVYYGIENKLRELAPHIVQWLLSSYNTQILLMVFMGIVSLLLAGFFGYHAHLCLSNTTTNETFKWEAYISLQRKATEVKASAEALIASVNELNNVKMKKPRESKWKAFFRRSRLEEVEVVKKNIYDKGFVHNLLEITFPLSSRSMFLHTKAKSQ